MNYGWPIAFAFVGMCMAIAWANANQPPSRNENDVAIECIKAKGQMNIWGRCIMSNEAKP